MLPFLLGWHKQTCIVTVFKMVETHRKANRLILKSDELNDAVIDAGPVELLDDAGVVMHQDVPALQQFGISNPEEVRMPGVQHTQPDSHLVCLQEPHVLSLSPAARDAAVRVCDAADACQSPQSLTVRTELAAGVGVGCGEVLGGVRHGIRDARRGRVKTPEECHRFRSAADPDVPWTRRFRPRARILHAESGNRVKDACRCTMGRGHRAFWDLTAHRHVGKSLRAP